MCSALPLLARARAAAGAAGRRRRPPSSSAPSWSWGRSRASPATIPAWGRRPTRRRSRLCARVDAEMSLYRPESELVRVNTHAARHPEPIGPELFALLTRARELSIATDGAFDVTILPLLRAVGRVSRARSSRRRQRAHRRLRRPDARSRRAHGELPPARHGPRSRRDRQRLRPRSGAAPRCVRPGYGARASISAACSGCSAPVPTATGAWPCVIRARPRPRSASSGSGPTRRCRRRATTRATSPPRVGARRATSTIPRNGRPVTTSLAVTVWAADATTADALSTALLVLGPDAAGEALAREPGSGALFVDGDGRLTMHGERPRSWQPLEPARREAPPIPAHRDNEEDTVNRRTWKTLASAIVLVASALLIAPAMAGDDPRIKLYEEKLDKMQRSSTRCAAACARSKPSAPRAPAAAPRPPSRRARGRRPSDGAAPSRIARSVCSPKRWSG